MIADAGAITLVTLTFLLAGAVKGVIGLGLPTVSLALLALAFDLTTAMALLLVPSFVTNLWQSLVGGHGRTIMRRLWGFLLAATVTVWIGAAALTRADPSLLTGLLGLLLVAYAAVSLGGLRWTVSRRHEGWAGPVIGTMNGVLTGMTGSFVVPGVMFLQAIGLPRDMLVQAMGVLFTLSTVALAAALQKANVLTAGHAALSVAAVLPALIGMVAGQRLRGRLSETAFRKVFFVALLLLGLYIAAGALRRLL